MSRIAFDSSTVKDRRARKVLKHLQAWLEVHPDKDVLDPRELQRAFQPHPRDLALALDALEHAGVLRQVYMVESEGVLLGGEGFPTASAVTPTVDGRLGGTVETEDLEIVPVYRCAV